MHQWEVRYRSPLMLVAVIVETFTLEEAEAQQLAQKFIDSLGMPSATFVRVRPIVVARSSAFPDLVETWGPQAAPPAVPARIGD